MQGPVLGAGAHERSEEGRGYANGYKPKEIQTGMGALELSIPQVRGLGFYPQSIEKGSCSERALKLAIAQMYLEGVSTRKVQDITERLCGYEVSSTQVSRLTQELDGQFEQFRNRPISEVCYLVKGVNANFVSELPSGMLKLRTFERGVEQETLACGTGAVATAIAASKMRGYHSPVKIVTALNEIIEIRLSDEGEVEMIGGATFVFKGRIAVKDQSCITV